MPHPSQVSTLKDGAKLHIVKSDDDQVCEFIVEQPAGLLAFTWLDGVALAMAACCHVLACTWEYQVGRAARHIWLLPFLCAFMLKRRIFRQESMLVIARVGIQLGSSLRLRLISTRSCPMTGCLTTFVPLSTVKDIILLEGINGWTVIWYLGIVSDDGKEVKIHVPFRSILPRLHVLRTVWKHARQVMYGATFAESADYYQT